MKISEILIEFAPGNNRDGMPCNPSLYYDIERLKAAANRLARMSVNKHWYDLQLRTLIGAMEDCLGLEEDHLKDMFGNAPHIYDYLERNIIKKWADGSVNRWYKPTKISRPRS